MSSATEIFTTPIDEIELGKKQQFELNQLLTVCNEYLDHVDEELISNAFKLSYESHKGLTRASGEPYYHHPIEVATIVAKEIGVDDISVASALLHDVVEDTSVSLDYIEKNFGKIVSKIIDGLTKISDVFKSKDTKQAETFMKLLITMSEDMRVILIKFADRLHNMRTLQHLPTPKQLKIATETKELYAPLAHRFGLFKIKSELEDLSFKYTYKEGYQFIARKLKEKKESREEFIHEFMEPIENELIKSGFHFDIKGRPKHIYSIYKKMNRQQKPFEQIYDLFAIRIILDEPHTKEDCWRVYSFITDQYKPIPNRFRDFISIPKGNGYQSLHTTVISKLGKKVEIQIRTRKMDEIAERGLAAHWKYKENNDSDGLDQFVHWVRDILDNPRPDEATDFVKDFQLNLNQEEIYVFTPKGELKSLPNGSTPIDFAFDIHSEIGDRAQAAKVNGQIVPLRHKLKSGDQVEIIVSKKINLNPDWINDVATHRAKARIRQFIRQKEREVVDEGREQLEKRLEKNDIKLTEQDLGKIATKLKFPTLKHALQDIGNGYFDAAKFVKAAKQYQSGQNLKEHKERILSKLPDHEFQEVFYDDARSIGDSGLIINGTYTDIKYNYSKCCNPIPGDDVIGFLSRTGEVKIHRTNCTNTPYLLKSEQDRIVDVKWPKKIDNQFVGGIKIIGKDRVGLITDITSQISKHMNTNMKSINVSSEDGMFEGTLVLFVSDIHHLDKIMKELQKIDGVTETYRFE